MGGWGPQRSLLSVNHRTVFGSSVTPWAVLCQAPRPWDFSGKNPGVGRIFFSRDLPEPEIESVSHVCQPDSLPRSYQESPGLADTSYYVRNG